VRGEKACRRSPSVSGGSFDLVSPGGFNAASIKISKKKKVNFIGLCKRRKKNPKCAATKALLDELAGVNVKAIVSLADFIFGDFDDDYDDFDVKKDVGKLGKFVQKKKGREEALNALLSRTSNFHLLAARQSWQRAAAWLMMLSRASSTWPGATARAPPTAPGASRSSRPSSGPRVRAPARPPARPAPPPARRARRARGEVSLRPLE